MDNSSTTKDNFKDTINMMNSWSFAFMLGFGVLAILMMQSLWDTISGLSFDFAYESIVIPYTLYLVWNLRLYSIGKSFNKAKLALMSLAFMLLFLPSVFLLVSGQLEFHAVIFSEYDPSLRHLPFSNTLPYIALSALFFPYKDFLTKE